MNRPVRWRHTVVVLAAFGAFGACGDDDPVGPGLGDLVFTPSSEIDFGSERDSTVTLSNVSSGQLGPIVVGANSATGQLPLENVLCPEFETTIVPNRISSLAPGAASELDVTIDDTSVDVIDCPHGEYEILLLASVNDVVLASVRLKIDWNEPD
jgi:hypothetical protein